MRRDMGSRGEVWVPGGRVADALGAGGGCVCEPGPRARAGRQSPPDDPGSRSAPPPRPAGDVSPAAPRPRRSARMRVTCGRHLPVPGSQRQSEPARAAAAITASAKSSARCPRHVSRPPARPPLATRGVLPRAGRHPPRGGPGGDTGGGVPPAPPVPPTRAAAARDCAWTPGTGPGRSGAGDGPGGGGGEKTRRPPARPAPATMAVSHLGSTPGSVSEVAFILTGGEIEARGGSLKVTRRNRSGA